MDTPTNVSGPDAQLLSLLQRGAITLEGVLPYSSNYSFLGRVQASAAACRCVYKPRQGENPLGDFPYGTLCQREVAAFVVSDLLAWHLVPPTILREAEYGVGSVQAFIPHDPAKHYFNLRASALHAGFLRRLVLFDYVINNADRKSGHCLEDRQHRLWAIDHGICFHAAHKLRTVIWEFVGQPIAAALRRDLDRCEDALQDPSHPATHQLARLLTEAEREALRARVQALQTSGLYPAPRRGRRNFPWPLI